MPATPRRFPSCPFGEEATSSLPTMERIWMSSIEAISAAMSKLRMSPV